MPTGKNGHSAIVDGMFMISKSLAASMAGVNDATFAKWIQNRDFPPPPIYDNGMVPAKAFGEWMRKEQIKRRGRAGEGYPHAPEGWGPMVMPTGAAADPLDKNAADVRVKTAQAEKIERENMVAQGLLIPADQIENAWSEILRRVRLRLLKLPSSIVMVVVGDANPHSVQAKIEAGVRDALSELSDNWRDSGVEDD